MQEFIAVQKEMKMKTKSIVIRFDERSTRCQVMLISGYMNE